ncbi:hypothetical protein ACP275_07G050400 [Erythranthe tilingii]
MFLHVENIVRSDEAGTKHGSYGDFFHHHPRVKSYNSYESSVLLYFSEVLGPFCFLSYFRTKISSVTCLMDIEFTYMVTDLSLHLLVWSLCIRPAGYQYWTT